MVMAVVKTGVQIAGLLSVDNRSGTAKDRWQRARDVAEVLDIGVKTAWMSLRILEKHDLVDPICAGIIEARELAQDLLVQPRDRDFRANANDVKLMLWAFDKIGDLERVKMAYKKAMMVCE